MDLSMWSYYLHELSPEEMVKTFSDKEWFKLELSDEHANDLLERGNPKSTGKSFKKYSNDLGVSFPQGHLSLDADIISEKQDEELNILFKWIDLFQELDVQSAVLHAGGRHYWRDFSADDLLDRRVKALNRILDYIKGTNINICIENTPSTIPNIGDMLKLMSAVNSEQLAICLDTGHLNIVWGNQGDFIRKAGSKLKALHIADNETQTDQHMMPYGRGNVNWPEVVKTLKEIQYKGLFNYEIPGECHCPMPVKLAKLDYLKQVTSLMLEN